MAFVSPLPLLGIRKHHFGRTALNIAPLHPLAPGTRSHSETPTVRATPPIASASAPLVSLATDNIQLGNSRVSALGVGTWAWGDRLFWDYGNGYTDDDLYAAYKELRSVGINFFDTAEVYGFGKSETLLAEFGRRYEEEGKGSSDEVVIATKYMPVRVGFRTVEKALAESRKRLKRDVVDLYQLHFPNFFNLFEERVWGELADLYQRGLVRGVGVG